MLHRHALGDRRQHRLDIAELDMALARGAGRAGAPIA